MHMPVKSHYLLIIPTKNHYIPSFPVATGVNHQATPLLDKSNAHSLGVDVHDDGEHHVQHDHHLLNKHCR